jgi:cytochrome c-type biogenesis protein CcmH/NrfG
VVITFAVHSAIDWTWFVPGDAVIALLCAGWVAGRGPEAGQHAPGRPSLARLARSPFAAATAAAAIALALIIGWSQWQPLRSEQAATAGSLALGNAEIALANGNNALARREIATARARELTAIARNPLDITPLVYLGYSYAQAGKLRLAQATFDHAIALQPSNAASWKALWEFDSSWSYDLSAGEHALYAAIDLNPWDPVLLKQSIELTPIS